MRALTTMDQHTGRQRRKAVTIAWLIGGAVLLWYLFAIFWILQK